MGSNREVLQMLHFRITINLLSVCMASVLDSSLGLNRMEISEARFLEMEVHEYLRLYIFFSREKVYGCIGRYYQYVLMSIQLLCTIEPKLGVRKAWPDKEICISTSAIKQLIAIWLSKLIRAS